MYFFQTNITAHFITNEGVSLETKQVLLETFFSITSRLGDNCAGCFKWDTLYTYICMYVLTYVCIYICMYFVGKRNFAGEKLRGRKKKP